METKLKYILGGGIIILIILSLIILPIQAFSVDHLNYNISRTGDAVITADYNLSFVESLTLPIVNGEITNAIKSEYGQDTEIIQMTNTRTQFNVIKFADKYDTYVQTPRLNFENNKNKVESYWFLRSLDIDYSPTVTTITSFNGSEYTYNNELIIPAMTLEL
jgi:hypothetical protein